MTPADMARLPLRRVRRARIIRTASQAPTQPLDFDAGVATEAWIREMGEVGRG